MSETMPPITSNSHPAYVGRWVAVLRTDRSQVVGVGETGPAALRAARRNRPKVKIDLQYVPDLSGRPLALSSLLVKLAPIFAQIDVPIFLVGGAVRDALLGRVNHDLDFAVPEQGIRTAFKVGDLLGAPAYVLDRERDTGRVVHNGIDLDFVAFRGETLEDDLRDRDLTLNAIACPALATTTAELIDPTGGVGDIAAGWIRQIDAQSLTDDPIRGLRAIRFAMQTDFALTPETEHGVQQALAQLDRPSAERVRDEMLNLMRVRPSQAFAKLDRLDSLAPLLPEVAALRGLAQSPPHHEPVLRHTLSVIRWLEPVLRRRVFEPDSPDSTEEQPFAAELAEHLHRPVTGHIDRLMVLKLGALLHDIGKAQTQTIDSTSGRIRYVNHDEVGAPLAQARMQALKFSREATDLVALIVQGHMRPLHFAQTESGPSDRSLHRFYRTFGSAGLEIALLSLADHLATHDGTGPLPGWDRLRSVCHRLIEYYFTREAPAVRAKPLLDGNQLIKHLGLTPGPEIGRLLTLLAEAQAVGEITTQEEALTFADSMRR